MAECSSSTKWPCSLCTYLNYETSLKCTVCLHPREKFFTIEEAAATSQHLNTNKTNPEERWCCPTCTYFNCLRTKKCIQCFTDRPLRYGSDYTINRKRFINFLQGFLRVRLFIGLPFKTIKYGLNGKRLSV